MKSQRDWKEELTETRQQSRLMWCFDHTPLADEMMTISHHSRLVRIQEPWGLTVRHPPRSHRRKVSPSRHDQGRAFLHSDWRTGYVPYQAMAYLEPEALTDPAPLSPRAQRAHQLVMKALAS